jgi:small-conductance mechanosensitive channel
MGPPSIADTGIIAVTWTEWLDERGLLVPTRILLILGTTYVVLRVVRRLVRKTVDGLATLRDRVGFAPNDVARAEARRRTMTTVVLSSIGGLIWTSAVLTVLSELGINLGAFVTGATIIGGALAFGAQQLVRDLIAGFFVLAEDQFGVGDTVDLGLATGTVERVTLRSTRLRDAEGRVWFVPHGNVQRAGNLTNGLVVVNIDVVVPVHADLDLVETELARIGTDVAAHDPFAGSVQGPGEVLGVERLDHNGVTLRWTVRCRPGEQYALRRAMRRAVAAAVRDGRLPESPEPLRPPGAPG